MNDYVNKPKISVTEEVVNKLVKKIFKIVGGSTVDDLSNYVYDNYDNNYKDLTDKEKKLIPILEMTCTLLEPNHIFFKDDITKDCYTHLDSDMRLIYESRYKNSNVDFKSWYENLLTKNVNCFSTIFNKYKVIELIKTTRYYSSSNTNDDYDFEYEFGMIIDCTKEQFLKFLIEEVKKLV